ncbi:MAG: hypothetical protein ACD_9C00196G0001 [uncultured bacterium]|nr:MAG: hypothetical protein ACD_9C00196G0001 [uncultured bacterium]
MQVPIRRFARVSELIQAYRQQAIILSKTVLLRTFGLLVFPHQFSSQDFDNLQVLADIYFSIRLQPKADQTLSEFS